MSLPRSCVSDAEASKSDRAFEVVDHRAGLRDAEGLPGALRIERLDVNDDATIAVPDGTRIVVNNAGVECANEAIEFGSIEDHWKFLFEANVFGLVRVLQRAVPVLRAGGGGVLCNVTSSSILAPVPFLGMYRASKAAVSALGESLAAEVAQFGKIGRAHV